MLVANLSDLRSFDLEEKQQICADFLSFPDHFGNYISLVKQVRRGQLAAAPMGLM